MSLTKKSSFWNAKSKSVNKSASEENQISSKNFWKSFSIKNYGISETKYLPKKHKSLLNTILTVFKINIFLLNDFYESILQKALSNSLSCCKNAEKNQLNVIC